MTHALPSRVQPRRDKIFGHCARPLDREAKVRLMCLARALMRPTQKGKCAFIDLFARLQMQRYFDRTSIFASNGN